MLGKIVGRGRRGGQVIKWLNGINLLHGYECEQAPGVGDGRGSLACCRQCPWDRKESDKTESWKLNSICRYNLRCADDTTLMAESEEELKSLLMKVKESE